MGLTLVAVKLSVWHAHKACVAHREWLNLIPKPETIRSIWIEATLSVDCIITMALSATPLNREMFAVVNSSRISQSLHTSANYACLNSTGQRVSEKRWSAKLCRI